MDSISSSCESGDNTSGKNGMLINNGPVPKDMNNKVCHEEIDIFVEDKCISSSKDISPLDCHGEFIQENVTEDSHISTTCESGDSTPGKNSLLINKGPVPNDMNNKVCHEEIDILVEDKCISPSEVISSLDCNGKFIQKNVTEDTKVEACEIDSPNKAACPIPCYSFDSLIEIAKSTKPFTTKKFLIGCKWSPDGTCLLTNCADYTIRLFDLPKNLYNKQFCDSNEDVLELHPSLKITEGGQIYDYDWYPMMSSWIPETCCFLSTSLKAPVHLWDAYTGQIRASYRGYNRADEAYNAISVKFSLNGEKIYCGYKNEIKIFDTSIPGRDCTSIDTNHVAGQCGLISCIAENPAVRNMFAAGSYRKTIGLYLETGDSICLLNGQRCGITHIMWSHDGSYLFSGARKNSEILCWDMRNLGEVLCVMERTVETNQRIYFDITSDGKYLISGNTNGKIMVWDINQCIQYSGKVTSTSEHQCHLDCTNGVSVHRQLPILATTSGQFHYPDLTSDDEDNYMFDVDKMLSRIENSVKLWWIGPIKEMGDDD